MSNKRKAEELKDSDTESEISSEDEQENKTAVAGDRLKEYYRRRPYRCLKMTDDGKKCPKAYKTYVGLHRHNSAIHLKIKYKCKECSAEFVQKTGLKRHIERFHERKIEPVLTCDLCPFETTKYETMNSHSRLFHGILAGRVQCSLCSKTFDTEETLQLHTQSYHAVKIKSPDIPKTAASAANVLSDMECSESSSSTGELSQGKLLHIGDRVKAEERTIAVMVSDWSSSLQVDFHKMRVGVVSSEHIDPDFNHMAQKHIKSTKFFNKGELVPMENLTGDVSKRKSFYFGSESGAEAQLARTCIMITQSFIELQRQFEKKENHMGPKQDFATSAQVCISDHNKSFLEHMFLDNNITWFMESKEEYGKRRPERSESSFFAYKTSKFISNVNLGLGHVYLVHAHVNGILHIYIGKRNEKMVYANGEKGGRISSTTHEIRGSLNELMKTNPEVSFKEQILFYLAEHEEPEFPDGESLAIIAFYLMQQSTGFWMKEDSKYVPFKLVNCRAALPTWTPDYAYGLRYLIYKYAKKRFNLVLEPGTVLPLLPKVTSVFAVLKAKRFK